MKNKLAVIYDWIDKWGGAERILGTVFNELGGADIYTLVTNYKKAVWANDYKSRIRSSFLDSWYRLIKSKTLLTPIMPFAIESFDLSGYETIFSISSSFGKGIITRPETRHICYLFSPTKYLWHEKKYYLSSRLPFLGFLSYLRQWDYIAAQRPDEIYTLSRYSQRLIKSVYGRDSKILPPPFDIEYFRKMKEKTKRPKKKLFKNYFLFVGRLEPYKRVDLLIETFIKRKDNLLIVGTGSSKKKLVGLANGVKNIDFIEDLSDYELAFVYQKAEALLMPQGEDFGYTALESIFFETPVISLKNSGTAEIVKDGENGVLFYEQTKISLVEALEKFKTLSYNFDYRVVERFAKEHFLTKLKAIIN